MTAPALDARSIFVSFGGVVACDRVDLSVPAQGVIGITGPNGSGKSTLLNAINGLVPALGELRIDGQPVRLGATREVRARGVIRLFQAPQVVAELTCLDNVLLSHPDRASTGLGATLFGRAGLLRHERQRWRDAHVALERVGLAPVADQPGGSLTYGQQRLVELARAIAGGASVLLLDEPSAGLNEVETAAMSGLLSELRQEGVALAVIDHKVDFLDRICDEIVVLQLGRVIARGEPTRIWRDPEVVDAYLGVPRDGSSHGPEGGGDQA